MITAELRAEWWWAVGRQSKRRIEKIIESAVEK
jgi:hypothetical protein